VPFILVEILSKSSKTYGHMWKRKHVTCCSRNFCKNSKIHEHANNYQTVNNTSADITKKSNNFHAEEYEHDSLHEKQPTGNSSK